MTDAHGKERTLRAVRTEKFGFLPFVWAEANSPRPAIDNISIIQLNGAGVWCESQRQPTPISSSHVLKKNGNSVMTAHSPSEGVEGVRDGLLCRIRLRKPSRLLLLFKTLTDGKASERVASSRIVKHCP